MTIPSRSRLVAAAMALILAGAGGATAQQPLPIFDAHLHYNQEPTPFYSLEQVYEVFRRNGVTGILATSRPNRGTHQLFEDRRAGLWVVPFLRPYRVRSDIQTWSTDPAIFTLIQDEFGKGYYRGIGEFHIHGKAAAAGQVTRTVAFARERGLFLHAHCDEEALRILLSHDPRAKIIWAHTGFGTPVTRVRELLEQHPGLMAELSYRSGITDGSGRLAAEWRELFARHSDRFLLGSDTWINGRWGGYDEIMRDYRAWLDQLPVDQARRIAHANAERVFGGRMGVPDSGQ